MMETKFDVVLVDVDTDESYALQIIAKLAELGPAVMAYSARTDEDLLKSCMRAGARDFVPLPSEDSSLPVSTTAPKAAVAPPQPAAKPVAAAQTRGGARASRCPFERHANHS
jgi:DNA-binding NarL/FixJ family response regulator